jgi:hypothetical protein
MKLDKSWKSKKIDFASSRKLKMLEIYQVQSKLEFFQQWFLKENNAFLST